MPIDLQTREIVTRALGEDIGSGDITTALTVPEDAEASAHILVKEDGIVCGLGIVRLVYKCLDGEVKFKPQVPEGSRVTKGTRVAVLNGPIRSILTGERVCLNFLQRLSGIATKTAHFVELISATNARIVDTRKTTPGLRFLEKYAVRVGGGHNHRFGLDDGILIKDNHIAAAGGVAKAVTAAKRMAPHTLKIEVEAKTLDQVGEALSSGADAILLDNMTPEMVKEAVELVEARVVLEVSGQINEDTVTEYAAAGVDVISVGALTHSVKALDISMDIAAEAEDVGVTPCESEQT